MKSESKLPVGIIAAVAMLGTLGLWFFQTKEPFHPLEWVTFGSVILIVVFMLYFKIDRYKSEKSGLTAEDELSKRIKEKAAAKAYKISVFMWTFIIIFVGDMPPQSKIILSLGLIGMGLVFLFIWFSLSRTGLSDENQD